MGTMIQRYKLTEEDFRSDRFKNSICDLKGNNDLLSLHVLKLLKKFMKKYLKLVDIIETNTFSSTSVFQSDYDLQTVVYDINFESVESLKKRE